MIAALVLAGGSSSRMGEPKALLPFPDLPLLAVQWLALRLAGLDPLRIVVGRDADRVVAGSGLARENFVRNRARLSGPFSSVRVGLEALLAAEEWPAVVVQPVDAFPPHPTLVAALAERFLEGGVHAVIPAHRGRGGHPVMLSREVAEEALRLEPRRSRLDVLLHRLEAAGVADRVEVYSSEVLANLNDRAAYRRALRSLAPAPATKRTGRRSGAAGRAPRREAGRGP